MKGRTFVKEKSWISIDYPCVVIMGSIGHRCGYVGVPKDHALYEVDYNEETSNLEAYASQVDPLKDATIECAQQNLGIFPVFMAMCRGGFLHTPSELLGVHGGITYSGSNNYPIPMEDYWWFGYDCGHLGDARDLSVVSDTIREIEERFPTDGVVRTLKYCFYECVKLADQLRLVDKEYKIRREILFRKFSLDN